MKDLLLIEAPIVVNALEEKTTVPPLNLAYIAAVCETAGFKVDIMDLNHGDKGLDKKIEDAGLIGISCFTHNYHDALDILRKTKEHGKKVVIGGPHVSFCYEEALRDGFDFVVRGEGEFVILELLKRLKEGGDLNIRGLIFKENGKIRKNGVWRVENLDALPFPARHLLKLHKYTYPGAIATSRGCVNHCIFCSSRNISGRLRLRSAESVVEEITHLKNLGIDSFLVVDPNFAYDKKRTLEICNGVEELEMEWYAELRLDHVDGEVIRKMAGSGCRVVRFGIESGSQRIVDFIKKGIELKDLLKTIETFVKNGITPVCGFMIGHPHETGKDFEKTMKLAKKIKDLGGEATFAVQTPYPGTYLFKNAERLDVKILHKEWNDYHHLNPVIETESFTIDNLRRMLSDALLMNREGGAKRKSFRNIALSRSSNSFINK
ncbi:MAG: radical SAM protein [Thermodesulfobacteriota bacterium]